MATMSVSLVCRTCMSHSNDLHYIFYLLGDAGKTVAEVVEAVAQVQITLNDNLPQYMCGNCILSAKSALTFKNHCQQSDAEFKRIISSAGGSMIKKELENCANENSYSAYKIKEENENSESMIVLAKTNDKADENSVTIYEQDKSYTPYQCAVCCSRFCSCNELEEHVKNVHEKSDVTVVNGESSVSCLSEVVTQLTCTLCHKTFSDKKKLLAHTKRCEKKHKNFPTEDHDYDNNYAMSELDDPDSIDIDEFDLKPSKIKTEPEVLLSTETYVDQQSNSDKSHVKKIRSVRKNSKKSKKNKLTQYIEDMVDENGENIFGSNQCEVENKTPVTYSCTSCERKFTKKTSLEIHLKRHEEQQKTVYTCPQCKRTFQRKGHLDNHILTHASNKGFVCNICHKGFAKQESLNGHLIIHKYAKKHECTYCQKRFGVLSTLKDHIRTHTGEKPYLCSICGRSFSQSTNLKEHIRRHQGHKPFKCPSCEQSFVSKGELEAHARKHSGAHPFVCDVCGGGFTTSSSLVKHMRIHTGVKPYRCDYCEMSFTALGTLKNHTRRHTGEKPYKCMFCEKAFAQKNDLVSHTRTHTGERPYVCNICGHAFRQSSALKTHLKTHSIAIAEPTSVKFEKKPFTFTEQPLAMEGLEVVSMSMLTSQDGVDETSSVTVMTPKSESSH